MQPKDHPTTENITCPCGVTFEWTNEEKDEFWRDIKRPKHCEPCREQERIKDEQLHKEIQRIKDERILAEVHETAIRDIEKITPRRYRQSDVNHPEFNTALWKKLHSWRPGDELPFLGLVGQSGACKSRIAFMFFRLIILERIAPAGDWGKPKAPSFAALTSSEFASLVGRQFLPHSGHRDLWDNNQKAEARRTLDSIRECKILLLDDLGKCKNTPSVAAELFAVIDHRHAENLPTIWTANSTPEEIVSGMADDIAGPLAGRLIECSNIITV